LPSPEPIGRTGLASSRRRVLPSSRAVGCALEGPPASYRLMGSAIPPRGSSTSWSSPAGREPCHRLACLPRPFAPLRSMTRTPVTPSSSVLRLSRGLFPHGATQSRRATIPGVASSGSCCVPAVPAGLDALLPSRSPRSVSSGRALGVLPSELDLAWIACASRRRFPSCDWLAASRYRPGTAGRRFAPPRSRARAPSPFGFGAWRGTGAFGPFGPPDAPDRGCPRPR